MLGFSLHDRTGATRRGAHRKKDETDWINLIDQVIELALLP